MDDPTRRALDAIRARRAQLAAELAQLDEQARELIRRTVEEMHRTVGLTAAESRQAAVDIGLPSREQKHKVNSSMMTAVHKVAISAGRKKKDAFLQAIRAKGYTLRGLAAKLDIPPSLISMYRSGDRPIPDDRAKRIEELTGWKATRANWPGGIA